MTPEAVLELARQTVWVMLAVGAPALLAALVVGVLISLLQALTQIQENTLSFLPKLVAILAGPAPDPAVRASPCWATSPARCSAGSRGMGAS